MNFAEDELCPGWPGRGYDPTASFTNTQWYLYHQRNVAFFAAFASIEYDRPRAIALARGLISLLPHLADGYRGGPTEGILGRLVSVEDVTTLDGFPERWMTDGREVFADANLPLFRIRIARRTGGTDAEGRRAFVLVWVSHALAEGTDSTMLSRSRDATHVTEGWKPLRPGRRDILAKAVGAMAPSRNSSSPVSSHRVGAGTSSSPASFGVTGSPSRHGNWGRLSALC